MNNFLLILYLIFQASCQNYIPCGIIDTSGPAKTIYKYPRNGCYDAPLTATSESLPLLPTSSSTYIIGSVTFRAFYYVYSNGSQAILVEKCDITCYSCFWPTGSSQCRSCPFTRQQIQVTDKSDYEFQTTLCSCIPGYEEVNPVYAYCREIPCQLPCKTCVGTSNTDCATCNDNMTLSGIFCNCNPRYYMDAGVCKACLIQCQTCTNGTSCTTCGPNRAIPPSCSCSTGFGEYYTKQLSCLACLNTCGTCSTFDKCVTCDEAHARILSGTSCVCPTKYYFEISGQPICQLCHESCLTCTNATTCSSCTNDPNIVRAAPTYTCICQPGWAKSPLSTLCVQCDSNCETCEQNNYEFCTKCIDNTFRYLKNGSCPCMKGFYEMDGITKCQECDYTCTSCSDGGINKCTSCGDNTVTHRYLSNKMECICDDYYGELENVTNCQPCISTCDKCTSYKDCTTCKSSQFRILNEIKCVCKPGYYEYNGEDICRPCHYTCNSCTGQGEFNCLTCDGNSGRELSSLGACPCIQQFYDEGITTCAKCYYNCLTCDYMTSDKCLTCPTTRTPALSSPGHYTCPCTNQKSIDDGENLLCTVCHYSCDTCTGVYSNNCLTCVTRTFELGSCVCPDKFYDDGINETCLPCHETCLSCQDSTDNGCITCSAIEFRVQYGQRCECIPRYLMLPGSFECVECNYRCDLCEGDQMHCTTCPMNSERLLNPLTNICECPKELPNDIEGEPVCQPCHYSCQNCTTPDENKCTMCEAAAYRTLANGYCPCDPHFYNIGNTECEVCSEYCGNCIDTNANCTSCDRNVNRYLVGSECKCVIKTPDEPLSYYETLDKDVICEACHYSCYTCNGPNNNQCLTCLAQDFRVQNGAQCVCLPKTVDKGVGQCFGCNYKCDECVDSSFKCTICPIDTFRVHDPTGFTCNCELGYFDDGTPLCKLCDIKCETCANTAVTCLTCKSGMNRILTNFYCVCVEQYYDSNLEYCEPCHYSCQSCSGPTSSDCSYCSDFLTTHRVTKSGQCKCFDGYFDKLGNIECQKCSTNCETCLLDANDCQTCIGGQFRQLVNGICTCLPGYVDINADICLKCDANCKTCNTQPSYCESCPNGSNRELNAITKTCDCASGYSDVGTLICLKCHYTCRTCQSDVSKCITCPTDSFRELTSLKECSCVSGTYEDGQVNCLECDPTCETCVTKSFNCLTCDPLKNRIFSNSSCFCKDGFWEMLPSKVCQLCDPSCLTCFGDSLYCMSCDASLGRQLMNNTCVCTTSKYYDSATQSCLNCAPQCYQCTGTANFCDSCPVSRTQVGNNCECNPGYYDTGIQQCQPCSNKCETCQTTATFCLTCRSDMFRLIQANTCPCITHYYEKGTRDCGLCHYSCEECSGSQDNCTICTTDSIVNRLPMAGGMCLCKPGFYDDSQLNCKECHYSCKTCITTATKCTSCELSLTFRLDFSFAKNSCPCLPTFLDVGIPLCKKCAVQCVICEGQSDNCTLCNSNAGNNRVNITPACPCQTGYYADGMTLLCHKCHPRCGACDNVHANCTTCSGTNRLAAPSCGCEPGFYEDPVDKQCKVCKLQCDTCDNPNACITCRGDRIGDSCSCPPGFYDGMVNFCKKCILQCKECDISLMNCTVCQGNRINIPKCVCPDHYYDDNLSIDCQQCDYTCDICTELGCVTCAGNRILKNNQCDCPTGAVPYTTTPYCSDCSVAVLVITFLEDSSGISILFDFPLKDQFSDINLCLKIFNTETLKLLGAQPICQIDTVNDKLITATFGEGASLMENDEIILIKDVLKHKNCDSQLKTYIMSKIVRPKILLTPELQLKGPLFPVSPCNQIEIYFGKQLNDGKRNFQKITWNLLQINDPALKAIIEEANLVQSQQLTFPSASFPDNSNITINCAFTTFLNLTNQQNYTIMTINSKSPYLQFQTTQDSYYSWQPIPVVLNYKNLICSNKLVIIKDETMDINVAENTIIRTPGSAKPIVLNQTVYLGQPEQDTITFNIPAFTLTIGAHYQIMAETINVVDNVKTSAYFDFTIQNSPLLAQIKYGTRIQTYYKDFTVEAQARDPQTDYTWNEDEDISVLMECIDVSTQGYCRNQLGEFISVNKFSVIQHVKGRALTPFTVQKWQATFHKGDRTVVAFAMIVLLDEYIPELNFLYPQGWQIRKVNINEVLEIIIPLDPKSIYTEVEYSVGFIYDYNNVGLIYSKGNVLRFRIWDKFSNFTTIDKITLQVMAHDLKQFMPAVGTITLMVNTPPINCLFTVSPPQGNAVFTNFTLLVENARDSDQPINYKYSYYSSQEDYDYDILNGVQLKIIDLNNFQKQSSFKTILPSGMNNSIWIVAQISDAYGSVSNSTKQISIPSLHSIMKKNNQTCQSIIDSIQGQIKISLSYQLIVIQELVTFYNKTEMECKILVAKEINIQKQEILELFLNSVQSQHNQQQISRMLQLIESLETLAKQNRLLSTNGLSVCAVKKEDFNLLKMISSEESPTQVISGLTPDLVVTRLRQVKSLVETLISDQIGYLNTIKLNKDVGSEATQRIYQINYNIRINLISVLSGLFSNFQSQTIMDENYNTTREGLELIRYNLNQLTESFGVNFVVNNPALRVEAKQLGINVRKLTQFELNKLVQDNKPPKGLRKQEEKDLILPITYVFVLKIVKYENDPFLYDESIAAALNNQTIVKSAKYDTITTISPLNNKVLLDIVIEEYYGVNGDQQITLPRIFEKKFALNFEIFMPYCINQTLAKLDETNSTYELICGQYQNGSIITKCKFVQIKENATGYFTQCSCTELLPTTLFIQKQQFIYNNTIVSNITEPVEDQDILSGYYQENWITYIVGGITLMMIFILIKVSRLDKNYSQIAQEEVVEPEVPVTLKALTKRVIIDSTFVNANFKKIHEIYALFQVDNPQFSRFYRALLLFQHIYILIALTHITNYYLPIYLSIILSNIGSVIMQMLTKILEGLFTVDIKQVRIIGAIISIGIMGACVYTIIIFDDLLFERNIWWVITFTASFLLEFTIIEYLIITVKIKGFKKLAAQLNENRMDPVINFLYYFVQSYIVRKVILEAERQ